MNILILIVLLVQLSVSIIQGFFLFKGSGAEVKSALYCFKVCPLYCGPHRSKRDVDDEEMSTVDPAYFDEEEIWDGGFPEDIPMHWPYPPHTLHPSYHPYTPRPIYESDYLKWKHWTTTMKPTTTKKPEPDLTFICWLCKLKCNYPPQKDKK